MDESHRYCLLDTAIGTCGIAWSGAGLTRMQLPEADAAATAARLARHAAAALPVDVPAFARETLTALRAYALGERIEFCDLPLDLAGTTDFDRLVYDATRRLRWGETASYGEIAGRIGKPGAARGVGQALGRNPLAIVVPCHRVLAKAGRMGGFSAHGGVAAKHRLLALERALTPAGAPFLPGIVAD